MGRLCKILSNQDKVEFNDTWFLWDGYYRTIIKFFARLEIKYNVFFAQTGTLYVQPKVFHNQTKFNIFGNQYLIHWSHNISLHKKDRTQGSQPQRFGGWRAGGTPKRGWVVLYIQYIGRLTILGSVGLRHFCHGQCQPHIRCKNIFRYLNIKF